MLLPRYWPEYPQAIAWMLGVGMAVAVVVLVLLSWGNATFSAEVAALTTQSGSIKTYTDPDYGYSFDYPADWMLQRSIGNEAGDAYTAPGTAVVLGPTRRRTLAATASTQWA